MKKEIISLLLLTAGVLHAQENQSVSTGASYGMQSYFGLESGMQKQVANNAWDIAFNVLPGKAGVFINESVGSAGGATAIEAFYTLSGDFEATPDPGVYEQFPLMNLEKTWDYGAINEIRSPDDPDDYGWGYYNPDMDEVTGNNVFIIRLRNGTDLKLQVQSMSGGVYTFRYADLDGSNEVVKTISKADHSGQLLAYYSFATNDVVDVEPADGFDLVFCRYTDLLEDPGGGDPIPYLVTGILSGSGVEVAQADGVDPDSVMFSDYQGALSSDLGIIGQDWKEFDLGNFAWIIVANRVYFVKTANDRVWKIRFLTFGGSGNGTATFEKTDLGILSAVHDISSPVEAFGIFPNPVSGEAHVVFEYPGTSANKATLQLLDVFGNVVSENRIPISPGLNAHSLPVHGVANGTYYVNLVVGNRNVVREVCVVE